MTRTNPNNQRLPVNLNPDFLIRFPPFPTVPPGVTIIPFKDWKQRGIRVDPWPAGSEPEGIDSETETDILGIPTVPMKKRHPTDEPKSHQRKKRLRKSNQIPDAPGPEGGERRGWMNSRWESGELARLCTVDPRDTQIARLYAAAGYFKSGRAWPAPQRLVGLVDLWELFRRFIGVPDSTKGKVTVAESDSEDDPISDEVTPAPAAEGAEEQEAVIVVKDGSSIISPATIQAMQNALRDEENSTRFLDDPAETVKLFLSSYTRDKGYLYAEPNLFNLPHLATYFISFLIRSRVLPEIERELKSALAVSHLAERELPATGRVGKLLPDPFGRGCVDLWGTKGTGYQRAGVVWGEEEIPKVEEKKVDGGLVEEAEDGWKKVDVVEPVLEAEAGGWGWGSNADTGGWGSGGASTGGWGQPADEASAQWTLSDPTTTLLAILGPTALPLTHTPGIIENSMRRIISFSPPPPVGSVGKSPVVADPDAEAVEAELERMFGKIVLGPWVGWNVRDEFEHITVPSVAKGSRGAFVDSSSPPSSDATQEATGLKPHDPLKDNITILIAPETYKTLDPIEGLGIAGTFVQLARIVDLEGGVVKKKKGKKGKGREERFWYVDDTTLNIPSFWKQVPKVKKEGKGKKGKGKKVEED